MKGFVVRFASLIAMLTVIAWPAFPQAVDGMGKSAVPFPSGYDFPAKPGALEKMVQQGDEAGIRRHGWYLWAGLNQPWQAGWPIWRSWPIATQAFWPFNVPAAGRADVAGNAQPIGRSLREINVANNPSINLALPWYQIPDAVRAKHQEALKNITESANIPDGANFQNNGDLMVVSESYDPPAYKSIRTWSYYLAATLNGLLKKGDTDIQGIDRQSIVLKYMYWPVKRTGLTALPVYDVNNYDQPASPVTTYVGFENAARWTQAVAIDPTRTVIPPGETASVTYLHGVYAYDPNPPNKPKPAPPPPIGPTTYPKAKVVPMTDFYYKQISQQEYDGLSTYDKVLLDASFWWVHGRLFEAGDYVVSLASHIVTKEMPSWALQTVWWNPNPDDSRFAKDRPQIPKAQGPWRHYLLTTEYGITGQNGSLPIAYNPYIELASHPVTTNCRNCHIRSTWSYGCYITDTGPDSLANIGLNNPIFANLLHTDFLWTITDRAIPRPPSPPPNACH